MERQVKTMWPGDTLRERKANEYLWITIYSFSQKLFPNGKLKSINIFPHPRFMCL